MNSTLRLTLGLAAAATAAAVGAWALARLRWGRRTPEEIERLRRLDVNRRGRITQAHIVDVLETDTAAGAGRLLVYKYEVSGVTYEVAQDVSALPQVASAAHALAGRAANIKYDTRQPTNSILVCEEWSGISLGKETGDCGLETREEPRSSVAGT